MRVEIQEKDGSWKVIADGPMGINYERTDPAFEVGDVRIYPTLQECDKLEWMTRVLAVKTLSDMSKEKRS